MDFESCFIEKYAFPSPNPQVKLYMVCYQSGDYKVRGMMAEPVREGKYDGFLYLRGGIKGVGMVRPARIAQFASEGFILFAPFYRGNRGGEGNEDFAGEDREDAFAAYNILKRHPRLNHDRIHVFGFSRGGVMALLTAIENKDCTSVTSWGGVTDMSLTYEERVDLRKMMKRVIGGSPSKCPENFDWRTPLHDLEEIQCPTLIVHGMKDKNVTVKHSQLLEDELKRLHKQVNSWYFEEYTHYFPPAVNRKVVKEVCQWMKRQGMS